MARKLHDGFSDQFKASQKRRADAQALFDSARWRGSLYVGGYAVECLLKASLMRRFGCQTVAELDEELKDRGLIASDTSMYTHQLQSLFQVAGHLDRLRKDASALKAFNVVNRWIPDWRYDPHPSNREEAEDFLEALDRVITWIRANI